MGDDMLTLNEAAKYLGVSRHKVWSLVKEGALASYANPLDKRQKLLRREDLERLRSARPANPPAD